MKSKLSTLFKWRRREKEKGVENEYRYKPLSRERKEIRLITLLPGERDSEIRIELANVPVDTEPVYEAYSYVWGHSDHTNIIHVQDHERTQQGCLGVAHNLFIALQHLRHRKKPIILWIDAICINQQDIPERSAEVLEMVDVYKNADQVIVWLGPASHNSELAMDTVELLGSSTIYHGLEQHMEMLKNGWAHSIDTEEGYKTHAHCWQALHDMLRREWFSRLWVYQEIVWARRASIVIGERWLDWGIFRNGIIWFWTRSHYFEIYIDLPMSRQKALTIYHLLNDGCTYQTVPSYIDTLQSMKHLLCSDPRDRLFAIRGLLPEDIAKTIVPDYSISVTALYADFARSCVLGRKDSDILQFAGLSQMNIDRNAAESILSQPSWIPDWTILRTGRLPELYPAVSASGLSASVSSLLPDDILSCHGVIVGQLHRVDHSTTAFVDPSDTRELCRKWMKLITEHDSDSKSQKQDRENLFFRMIVSDKVSEVRPTSQGYPSILEVANYIGYLDDRDKLWDSVIHGYMQANITSQAMFLTSNEQYFGLGPEQAQSGDCIAVVLGCLQSLILRPDEHQKNQFRLVGVCYVPAIMQQRALLGPLPLGWTAKLESIEDDHRLVFKNGGKITQQDPRMLLPQGWRFSYADEEDETEYEAEKLDDMKKQRFLNIETGERTGWDPRLTPHLLRDRGVDIQEILLA